MATAESVKAKIQGLINTVNNTTGGADTDLTAAVNTLVAGFGQGGSGGGESGVLASVLDGTITELSDDSITEVFAHALRGRDSLRKVDLPNCLQLGNYAFAECDALVDVNLPRCTSAAAYAFQECGIEIISLPSITGMINTTFLNCKSLRIVDLVSPSTISTNAFNGCTVFETLILRKTDSIVPCGNVTAFKNSPFATGGTGGTVYVPSALIETYQTATNWSTLYAAGTCTFVAIEGSEYE